jgi:hypothetical protein
LSSLNEAAQWAALVFLSIVGIGLTRQIGNLLTAGRDQKAELEGPKLGAVVPTSLIAPDERAQMRALMAAKGVSHAGVIAMDRRCAGCDEMLADLDTGQPVPLPLLILSKDSDEAHIQRLQKVADILAVDGRRFRRSNLTITPFTMLLDEDFRLVKKAIATHLHVLYERWQDEQEDAELGPEPAVPSLAITRHGH